MMTGETSNKGFTLIEVLMVLAISLIFLGVSFAGYRDFTRRQEVLVAKRSLISDLRKAQKDAISGNKPDTCSESLVGYAFEITEIGPPAKYRIFALCKNPTLGPDLEILQNNYALSGGISVTLPSINPIVFYALNRGTNIPGGSSEDILISSKALNLEGSSGGTQLVNINWTGEID